MFPRVAELILVWAFPWPSGRRPAQGPPRLQVLGDELQAVLAAGHLVGFKSVDGEGRLVAAEGPVTGPVVDDALLRRVHGRRLVPVVAVVKVFRSVVEVTARMAEEQLWLVHQPHRSCLRRVYIQHTHSQLCPFTGRPGCCWSSWFSSSLLIQLVHRSLTPS
jgi:hypothetical protein